MLVDRNVAVVVLEAGDVVVAVLLVLVFVRGRIFGRVRAVVEVGGRVAAEVEAEQVVDFDFVLVEQVPVPALVFLDRNPFVEVLGALGVFHQLVDGLVFLQKSPESLARDFFVLLLGFLLLVFIRIDLFDRLVLFLQVEFFD